MCAWKEVETEVIRSLNNFFTFKNAVGIYLHASAEPNHTMLGCTVGWCIQHWNNT